MGDFIQKAYVKRSVRTLTTKIADEATLKTLVLGVIDTNAFQCIDYTSGGWNPCWCRPWKPVLRD